MPVQPTPPGSNPFLPGGSGLGAGYVPSTTDPNLFGLTQAELGSVVSDQGQTAGTVGPWTQQIQGSQSPDLDPFGIGVPITPDLAGTGFTVQQLLDYVRSLPAPALAQVQADLANAGYYGPMNSLTTEPQWGTLSAVDFKALGGFAKDLAAGAQSGTSPASLLALRTQQWNQQQQSQPSSLTPVKDLGKNYTITNLDPNEARSMVDKAALSVLGQTLPEGKRGQLANWLNTLYTSRQRSVDQGDIAQNTLNAQAVAQASDMIDPATGRALDHNGITAAARSQLGTPYVWGGTDPGKGLDCSGLVQWVYGQNGIKLPRTSQQQWLQGGGTKFSDMTQAQPGDLVFFVGGDGTASAPGHVGIYIGNGMMIDAPHTGSSVRIDNVQSFGGLVGFESFGGEQNTAIAASNMPPGTAPVGAAGGGSNQQAAYEFFIGKGLSPEQSAGIVGNLMQESNINPEDPGGGIAQWQGSRWNPALQTGNQQVDLNNQLNQVWTELNSSEGGALSALKGTSSAADAAAAFSSQYERPGDPMLANRQNYANQTLQAAQTNQWGTSAGGTDNNGGRSIVSTPNTFTQATDESSAALQATLEAQLRSQNPALAGAHDMTNAYTMLAKSLRDGITVNNS